MVSRDDRSVSRASGDSSSMFSKAGTITEPVTCSFSTLRHQANRERSLMVMLQPPLNRIGTNTIPLAWLIGARCSMRALRAGIGSGMAKWRSRVAIQLSSVYMIPLGRPVVPPVKRNMLQSSRSLSKTLGLSSLTPSSRSQKYRTSANSGAGGSMLTMVTS